MTPPELGASVTEPSDVLARLRERDILVQHPYDRFATSVEALVDQAADDPDVLAIKQTIYRTSDEGEAPVVHSLVRAEAGKEVVALVELTARGDEEANIEWARTLEKAGVHVLYGVVGLKTHAKTVLIVRREGADPPVLPYRHRQLQPGDGDGYEDVGLLSADPELASDVADLFNRLTGYSNGNGYRRILVAPGALRPRLLELIAQERDAKDGRIVMKMNSLTDPEIIDALYEASAEGTEIDLIVRALCCLRPGVRGLSERIGCARLSAASSSTPASSALGARRAERGTTSARPTSCSGTSTGASSAWRRHRPGPHEQARGDPRGQPR